MIKENLEDIFKKISEIEINILKSNQLQKEYIEGLKNHLNNYKKINDSKIIIEQIETYEELFLHYLGYGNFFEINQIEYPKLEFMSKKLVERIPKINNYIIDGNYQENFFSMGFLFDEYFIVSDCQKSEFELSTITQVFNKIEEEKRKFIFNQKYYC